VPPPAGRVQRFAALSMRFMGDGSPLPPQLREIAILRVGYLSNAAYEILQHEALARYVGLTDAEIAAIKAGGAAAAAFGEASAAVLAFTVHLVHNVRAGDQTRPACASISTIRRSST
jgi:alkylhydroperoxidase family enzyme